MKKTRHVKTWLSLVLALLMAFLPIAEMGFIKDVQAATNVTIRFHYHRDDGQYDGWKLYGWPYGGSGKFNDFSEDAYGRVATVSGVSATKYGFIVAKTDWTKDVSEDRFVTIPSGATGYIDVYLASGEASHKEYTSANGSVPMELISAAISGESSIDVVWTAKNEAALQAMVQGGQLQVSPSDNAQSICNIENAQYLSSGTTVRITFSEPLSLSKSYRVVNTAGNSSILAKVNYSGQFFEDTYTYEGNDLGNTYTPQATTFKVWAPTATGMEVLLFEDGTTTTAAKTITMTGGTAQEKGVWSAVVQGNYKNYYYVYRVHFGTSTSLAVDPYAKSGITTNDSPAESNLYSGHRGMVIDLNATSPAGWSSDQRVDIANPTDAVIYETSVRDFSSDSDSGISPAHRKKYLAFTEYGTKNSKGTATGLDYLSDLGITHVQLMPTFDFEGINELNGSGYNWGYNPVNYNIPEGSFATDPKDGNVRVNEYKQMVQALHQENIGVIMDVVYNHVNDAKTFSYNKLVPDYFFRGSNGSGCGNDVASERSMVSKYIVDSVVYWAEEYHLDGFRFDLVGLLDVDTMNALRRELNKINPDILVYGEGWSLGTSVTKGAALATQGNTAQMEGVGMFNDVVRDAIGGNNDATAAGYATGNSAYRVEDLKGAIASRLWFTNNPGQNINYISCHDNYTLWDKISKVNSTKTQEVKQQMNKLAAAINLTSQGIPLFLSGEEFLRTKNGNHNSYNSTDSVNMLDWSRVDDYQDIVNYYKGLIAFRNAHAGLRMASSGEIDQNLEFLTTTGNVIAYTIDGRAEGEIADRILVAFNPYSAARTLTLPSGQWSVCVDGQDAGTGILFKASTTLNMEPYSAYVLVQGDAATVERTEIFDAQVNVNTAAVPYTGKAITPEVSSVQLGGKTLTKGIDYKVTYRNNVNIGTASVVIQGVNGYTGRIIKNFEIKKGNNTLKITCATVTYGTEPAPKVTTNVSGGKVTYSYKKKGSADSTYTTTKPTAAGEYVVRAVSAETAAYYSATATCNFKIEKQGISKAAVSGITAKKTYTKKAIKQSGITVKLAGKTLKNGTDYKVTYSNNKNVGTAKVVITGIGNYQGTITKTFRIVPAKVSSVKATAKKKAATLKWKKASGAAGYQVYMATAKKGKYKKVATLKKASKISYTKKKLKKNKTYYFKVRAYKKVKGTYYYGAYSAIRSVKVK